MPKIPRHSTIRSAAPILAVMAVLSSVAIPASAQQYPSDRWNIAWLRTGQAHSYYAGDDADNVAKISIGVSNVGRFEITDSGQTVTDQVTGLVWMRDPSRFPQATWLIQKQRCDDLVLAGKDDWRMPNILELLSIIDVSKFPCAPVEFLFPNDNNNETFFGGDIITGRPDYFYEAGFRIPNSGSCQGGKSYALCFVRPVRAGKPYAAGDFHTLPDGKIYEDKTTGLYWRYVNSGVETHLKDALTSAAVATCGGFNDWRIPNANEFNSLFVPTKVHPAFDARLKFAEIDYSTSTISDYLGIKDVTLVPGAGMGYAFTPKDSDNSGASLSYLMVRGKFPPPHRVAARNWLFFR